MLRALTHANMVATIALCAVLATIPQAAVSQPDRPASTVRKSPTLPIWIKPAQARPPATDDAAIASLSSLLELWDTQFRVDGPRTQRFERRVTLIQQPGALVNNGTVRIDFAPDYQELTVHTLRILRGDKPVELLGELDFRVANVESGLDQLQITGRASAIAQIPGLRVGDRVELAYTVSGGNPVFGDQFSTVVAWNSPQVIARRQLRVVYPESLDLRHQMLGPLAALQPRIDESSDGRWREITFRHELVLPVLADRLLPNGFDPFTRVHLSTYANWREVRDWASSLFQQPATAVEVRKLASELRGGANEREAIERAVRFVQDEIRYFSILLNESSHRPRPPRETLERRFGDCKDKSVLLVALLQAMGIKAWPVLVSAQEGVRILRYSASPQAFDHVIVRIVQSDGTLLDVDATRNSDGVPQGKLSNRFATSAGLIIDSKAAAPEELTRLGTPQPALTSEVVERIKVAGLEQAAEARVESRLHGRHAEVMRMLERSMSNDDRLRTISEFYTSRHSKARRLDGFPRTSDVRSDNRYEIDERYTLEQVLVKQTGRNVWVARFGALRLLSALVREPPDPKRWLPLGIVDPYTIQRYRVEVEFPGSITGREDPIEDRMKTPFFELQTRRSFRGNRFEFSAELTVTSADVAPSQMKAFADSLDELNRKLIDVVVLDDRNLAEAEASRLPIAERIRRDMQAAVESASKLINGSRLADAELAGVYLERANAALLLEELAMASSDVAQAIRRAPSLGDAYAARSSLHLRQRQFGAAEADMTRALTLGADAGNSYLRRGQVRFLAGRYAEALQDFEQAEKSTENGINVGFMKVWQILSRIRLGQPVNLAPAASRDWPSPIIQYLTGRIGESVVVDAASASSSEDERTYNRCEAYFYIAMAQLARGDTAAARTNLQKSIDTGVLHYMEYELARIALKAL